MKGYQKKQGSVKGSIEVLDVESLVELASEGLLALSTRLGLEVVRQLLEADAEAHAGPKGTHNPDRTAYRIIRRVCNFKDGAMTLRYAAAGFLEAERGFRWIKGYKQIPLLQDMLTILQDALTRLTQSGDWATLGSA